MVSNFFLSAGKTSFIHKLIKTQYFTKKIKTVYYFSGCSKTTDLDWHNSLAEMDVSYHEGVPSSQFFSDIKPNSIVVIDDLYEEAIENPSIARAFKVDSRHKNFSIALITQVIIISF